ncbi:recombinase RecA [Candidatus Gracilibacteria bacterium CG17_big_fil_post_rev_8_21_14_2_50_48_13]|nr:MAG: recombinase RecA [Candidatus Gracilibacteria bacterium CG17_big_fil_post_rev_8_21_14_2_50_48_13]
MAQDSPTTDKKKAVTQALALIEKQFGKGSIMRLGENSHMTVETTSTASISLDLALGGGIPKGRVVEIYGPESAGKTTLCLSIIAQAQKTGSQAAFIDAEHALDPIHAENIGVDINNLLISQPDSGEQALEIVETLVRSGAVDVIVVDSVAALTPRAELEGEMGDSHMGLQARLMSQALRKLTSIVNKTNTTVIFINQLRMKIGVMFGNPETTTGGNALKFYSSVRIEVRKKAAIEQGVGDAKQAIGLRVRAKVVKNKVAPPFRQAEFDIMFNEGGISREGDILDTGVTFNLVNKSGSFYAYKDTKLGQGREQAKTFLRANPNITDAIEKDIRAEAMKDAKVRAPEASKDDEEDMEDDTEE